MAPLLFGVLPRRNRFLKCKWWLENQDDYTTKTVFYIDGLRPDLFLRALQILRRKGADPPRGRSWTTMDAHDCPPTAFLPSSHRRRARPVEIYRPYLKISKRAQEKERERAKRLTNGKRPSLPIHTMIARIKLTRLKLKGILHWVRQCQRTDRKCCTHNECESER